MSDSNIVTRLEVHMATKAQASTCIVYVYSLILGEGQIEKTYFRNEQDIPLLRIRLASLTMSYRQRSIKAFFHVTHRQWEKVVSQMQNHTQVVKGRIYTKERVTNKRALNFHLILFVLSIIDLFTNCMHTIKKKVVPDNLEACPRFVRHSNN